MDINKLNLLYNYSKRLDIRKLNKLGAILLSVIAPAAAFGATLGAVIPEAIKVTIRFENANGGTLEGKNYIRVKPGTKWSQIDSKELPTAKPNSGYDFAYWSIYGQEITDDTVITSATTVRPWFVLNKAPKIKSVKITDSNFWIYDLDSKTYSVPDAIKNKIIPIAMFNDCSVGYVSIEALMEKGLNELFEVTTLGKVTTITYKENKATCEINFDNQTFTFSDFEWFRSYLSGLKLPMTTGFGTKPNYFLDIQSTYKYQSPGKTVIDFKKYNIPLYFYNNSSYIPLHILKNIFGLNINLLLFGTDYAGFNFDWNGVGLFEIADGLTSKALEAKVQAKKQTPEGFYSESYMEYCYNLLALTLDFNYGMKQRTRRTTKETVLFFPNGAYAELKNYHNGLVSTQNDANAKAMRQLFKDKVDDGGHSAYTFYNALCTERVTSSEQIYGDEHMEKFTHLALLQKERDQYSGVTKEGKVVEGYKEYKKDGKDTIAYVTFDGFAGESGMELGEMLEYLITHNARELPKYTNETNYMKDTLRLTMYANNQIKANNIKNVVVDLTCNGGGTAYSEFFIASWLCGGVREKLYNPNTGSYCEFTAKADVNADGVFDDKDYLTEDVKVYIMTSSYSFSCGNLLPTNVQDLRKNATFIGTPSGGGACYVGDGINLGINSLCQISSSNHILRDASSYDNCISNDDGCTITSGWEIDDYKNIADFYKRDQINERIWAL